MQNQYLEQVVQQKLDVERDLKTRKKVSSSAMPMAMRNRAEAPAASEAPAVEVRVTGWGRWKTVVVPPNAFVVHTRRGQTEPLHCGLGTSFRYNPLTDAYLVVPSAMQTIVVNANCIVREKQGVLVQGYVQWLIDDFSKAYRALDFSDPVEPMKVVNVQLREQAEAAIKDTVAAMSIDDLLADKQPVIEELTRRLRAVAEGNEGAQGLGLRIVTVQIKEAVVSSARVWETIQRPFRAERANTARLAELQHTSEVNQRESEEAQKDAQRKIEQTDTVARLQAESEARAFDTAQRERARRAELQAQVAQAAAENETASARLQAELATLKLELKLKQDALAFEAEAKQKARLIELEAARMAVEGSVSEALLRARLIEQLPEIARAMPQPAELRSIQLGGLDGIGDLLERLTALVRPAE